MADRFGSDQVERALAMQEGSVLANEVLRLRERLHRMAIENVGLAAEVAQLQRELARLGPYPLEAVFKVEGEPDQFMFRKPDGGLVVLTRERPA